MAVRRSMVLVILALTVAATACSADGDTLTVYSGRKEELVAPLLERFEQETGIDLEIRYANSTDLAATLREEGSNTPADVFFAVDPASLGAVALEGLLMPLPEEVLQLVPAEFSDREGRWVGTSGRSRVIAYDDRVLDPAALPGDLEALTDPMWQGRLGIAPTNGSFLASVAAMILLEGEDATRAWLEGIAANRPLEKGAGFDVDTFVLDVGSDAACAELVASAVRTRGPLEIAVLNASTASGPASRKPVYVLRRMGKTA